MSEDEQRELLEKVREIHEFLSKMAEMIEQVGKNPMLKGFLPGVKF
jgi:hypothetical protein